MKIGNIPIDPPLVMAPLAGITDLPFRLIVKQYGCGLVYSEMISANGLVHQSAKTVKMLNNQDDERPLSVQLFGADPQITAEAARMAVAAGADIIDINFGCAVRKIIKTGSGVALMRRPEIAEALLLAVRRVVSIPLTIKIRSGWDATGEQALEVAQIAERCGVDAIAVHPRTATQRFAGTADWDIIRRVKQTVKIPVIGNGDITRPEHAAHMFAQTGCDAVMIGRAAIGRPWIFAQATAVLSGKNGAPIDDDERRRAMITYVNASMDYYGEQIAGRMMRSRLGWYVKGIPYNSRFKEAIKTITNRKQAVELIDAFFDNRS